MLQSSNKIFFCEQLTDVILMGDGRLSESYDFDQKLNIPFKWLSYKFNFKNKINDLINYIMKYI